MPDPSTQSSLRETCISLVAASLLAVVYSVSLLIIWIARLLPHARWTPTDCILVTGTFYNPNWFIAHASPLALCGVERIIFVTDTPRTEVEGIEFFTPPQWMFKVLGRAGAKFIYIFIAGLKFRPDCYIGYHLFPGALSALLVAQMLGRPSCYQMCAGPIEIIGGGNQTENALLVRLGRPYPVLEAMAMAITRYFDLIAIRGSSARQFLVENGVHAVNTEIIPGSINLGFVGGAKERQFDIIFVGRLAEIKQPMQLLEILRQVAAHLPALKVAIVGDGPLRQEMTEFLHTHGINDNVQMLGQRSDVETLLGQSKIFLLTSRNEGLSIAMAEAMASGAVPVVADVGDLSDLVNHGQNGYVISPNAVASYVDHLKILLDDPEQLERFSGRASEAARNYNGIDVVSSHWHRSLLGANMRHPNINVSQGNTPQG